MPSQRATYRAVLAYHGARFHGVAPQPGLRTVGPTLAQALRDAVGQAPVALAFAARTDAGVHARGQVASFRLDPAVDPVHLAPALRAALPADLVLRELQQVPHAFHARASAAAKHYRYRLVVGAAPALERRAWCIAPALDLDVMGALARELTGTRDFAALRSPHCHARDTVKTLHAVTVRERLLPGGLRYVVVDVRGDGFLRRMVRLLVGTLCAVGSGWRSPEDVRAALQHGDRGGVGPAAPAHGLTLWGVEDGYR